MGNKASKKANINTYSTTTQRRKCLTAGYIHQTIPEYYPIELQNIISVFHGPFFWIINMTQFKKIYCIQPKSKKYGRYCCFRKQDHKLFSLQKIQNLQKDEIKILKNTQNYLLSLDHPNIIKTYDIFGNKKGSEIYIIGDAIEGTDLYDAIINKGFINETLSILWLKQLLSALKYLHYLGIAHRDIKPENIMIVNKNYENSQIKLVNFDLSSCILNNTDQSFNTPVGTPNYVAPEILQLKKFNTKCDLWSVGVVLFIMLCGYPPFYDDNDNLSNLYQKIKKGDYEMASPYWDNVSNEAKDLVNKLLEVDPNKRLTAKQALEHKWLSLTDILATN